MMPGTARNGAGCFRQPFSFTNLNFITEIRGWTRHCSLLCSVPNRKNEKLNIMFWHGPSVWPCPGLSGRLFPALLRFTPSEERPSCRQCWAAHAWMEDSAMQCRDEALGFRYFFRSQGKKNIDLWLLGPLIYIDWLVVTIICGLL